MDRKTALITSHSIRIVQLVSGIILIFLGFLAIIGVLAEESGEGVFAALIFCLIIILVGVALIVFSRMRRKLINDFKTYVRVLSKDPEGSISRLATSLSISESEVKENLRKMIEKQYFSNAYIDQERNRVVIKGSQNNFARNGAQVSSSTASSKKVEYVSMVCKNCGGANKIIRGKVSECDYCGSPIGEKK